MFHYTVSFTRGYKTSIRSHEIYLCLFSTFTNFVEPPRVCMYPTVTQSIRSVNIKLLTAKNHVANTVNRQHCFPNGHIAYWCLQQTTVCQCLKPAQYDTVTDGVQFSLTVSSNLYDLLPRKAMKRFMRLLHVIYYSYQICK
jgi:hypothetical protein